VNLASVDNRPRALEVCKGRTSGCSEERGTEHSQGGQTEQGPECWGRTPEGCRRNDGGVDEIGAATDVDLLSGVDVGVTERLGRVASEAVKDVQGVLQALVASGPRGAGKIDAKREIVRVGVGGRGLVGDGICET
jgi:hypothetical protein